MLVGSLIQLARQGRPLVPQDLAWLDTVSMSTLDGRVSWQLIGPRGASYTLIHQPRVAADDLLILKDAVLSAIGICIIPDYMCREELQRGELVSVFPG